MIKMAIKTEIAKQTAGTGQLNIDSNLLSKAIVLWGLSAAVLGIVTAYSMTAYVIANVSAGVVKPFSLVAFPYELNAIGGLLNLAFGIALVAFGKKIGK